MTLAEKKINKVDSFRLDSDCDVYFSSVFSRNTTELDPGSL